MADVPASRARTGGSTLLGRGTAIAATLYVLSLVAVPLLEPGLDVLRAHPEDYAGGRFGLLVNLGYAALALALLGVAAGLAPGRGWTGWVTLALLLPPAALCAALAFNPVGLARTSLTLAVVPLAVAPLAITLTHQHRFGSRRAAALTLAAAVLIAFVGLLAAPAQVGGAVNRVFDILAGAWVTLAALTGSSS